MKNIAILGATGLVGEEVLNILEQRNFPIQEVFLFASERSEGKTVVFKDRELEIFTDYEDFIDKVDISFGCLDAPLAGRTSDDPAGVRPRVAPLSRHGDAGLVCGRRDARSRVALAPAALG